MEPTSSDEPGAGGPFPPPPPLPAQMFTTAAQLLNMTDKKLMVALRDGRKLIGTLRSWDQFANLVLQSTVERIFVPPPPVPLTSTMPLDARPLGLFADIPRGIFLVRGENVLLLGEIDLDKDDDIPPGYKLADVDIVQKLAQERKNTEARKDKLRTMKLKELGFEDESSGEPVI
ncbi:hypothetical protein K3495_g57 [Podosphaera aphanis]|nr:hypothetical protein K3495_g57 [Podosphaera aphanis]